MPLVHGPVCHSHGVRGYGDPGFGVVLVGIAPGRDEATRTQKPFTGPSGDLLDKLLSFAGWSRNKVYTTNVLCWLKDAPTADDIQECWPRLSREVEGCKPKLIVTAGAIPNETLMGAKRRKGSRGSVVWAPRWNAYVLDTHHPAFCLHAKSMSAAQDLIRDLSKIPAILDWPVGGIGTVVNYTVVESLAQGQEILDNLPRNTPVALDIETSSSDVEVIDAYANSLLCFSISWDGADGREHTVVFPRGTLPTCVRDGTHASGRCVSCELPKQVLRWPLDVHWLFQAGQYDINGIYTYFGTRLPLCDDTMLMSACTDERPGYHSLKNNAREWLGAGWWEEGVKSFYKGKMNQLSDETVNAYNAKDAAYTKRLVPVFTKKMADDGTEGLYRNILVPAIDTFISMQIRGINVDQTVLKGLAFEWFPRYLQMYKTLQAEANEIGWPTDDINLNSSMQLAKFLYQILGVEITKKTKTGRPSVDKETLDRMDHPFAAKIRAYRTLDTMVEYVLSVYSHLKYDGLLHPSAFVTTTRTGRTSYRDPAMQTLPKDYTVGADYAKLRNIIIAHDPATHEIMSFDFQQIEVWMAWAWSHDPVLLSHLESGDVHSATAELAFSTKRELWTPEEWDVKRQGAKRVRFGLQYGEGAEKLSSPPPIGLGTSVWEARKFVNNYWASYPTYRTWYDGIQREALTKGFLRLPSGRVMRFPVILDHKELRQAVNFPIQGTSSEYNLMAMIEAAPLLRQYNSWIILNIHDDLTVESDRRYRREVYELMKRVMEKPRFPGFPSIRVDAKVGDSLGQVKKLVY